MENLFLLALGILGSVFGAFVIFGVNSIYRSVKKSKESVATIETSTFTDRSDLYNIRLGEPDIINKEIYMNLLFRIEKLELELHHHRMISHALQSVQKSIKKARNLPLEDEYYLSSLKHLHSRPNFRTTSAHVQSLTGKINKYDIKQEQYASN